MNIEKNGTWKTDLFSKEKKDKKREMNYCNYLEDDFRGDFSPEDNFSQSSDEFSSERK